MKIPITSFLIALSLRVLSCSCAPIGDLQETQKDIYYEFDLIFLGSVVSYNEVDKTYKMKVFEVLKGSIKDSLIVGKYYEHSCSLLPKKEDGIWLVYTNPNGDTPIDILDCGLSRSFEFPFLSNEAASVPPPPKEFEYYGNEANLELQMRILEAESKKKALMVLENEINQIRNGYRD